MLNIFQMLFELVKPIQFGVVQAAAATGAASAAGAGAGAGGMGTLGSIGMAAGGAGSLMQGIGALMGGGGGEQNIRDMYPSQTMDYTNYAMAMQRETRNKILNMIAKRSYEGYEGGKNLANVGMAAAMEGTKTETPDYFAQAKSFAKGDEGAVGEVLSSFAPSTTIYKDPSELTEWDRIAEKNGITVTKYNDFQSQAELRDALFEKNKSEVEVSDLEVFIAEKIVTNVLGALFPGRGLDKLCYAGQCDDMFAGVIRGIKAMSRTSKQMGIGVQVNPALTEGKKTEKT